MGMPFSKINIGDIFESPLAWTGTDIIYLVTDKADGMIEVRSSYQNPNLPETMWKKPSDRIFTRRIYCVEEDTCNEQCNSIGDVENYVKIVYKVEVN